MIYKLSKPSIHKALLNDGRMSCSICTFLNQIVDDSVNHIADNTPKTIDQLLRTKLEYSVSSDPKTRESNLACNI